MNCSKVQEVLSAFMDGEIDSSQAAAIQAHLLRCPECRSERDYLEKVGIQMRNLQPLTVPPDFEFRIYSGIRSRVSTRHTPKRLNWRMVLIPATTMLVGIIIGWSRFAFPTPIADTGTDHSLTASTEYISMSPVTADADGLREYTIDTYVPNYSSPITVDTIPDDELDYGQRRAMDQSGTEKPDYQQSNRFVLDQMPVRVTYERTIY
jgi:Putative zinc-finger